MKSRLSTRKSKEALHASVSSPLRILSTVSLSAITFSLMTLSSFPGYSLQFIGSGLENIPTAIIALAENSYATGLLNISLTVAYAGLIGISLTNLGIQLKARQTSKGTIAGIGPGFIAAGCAGCGAGVLGFLGFTGALAALPFQGNGIRIAGLLLLLYFILATGNPETCEV